MKQEEYSGLARAYATAPALAVQKIGHQIEETYALIDVSTDALKKHQGCATASAETVLTRAAHELHVLGEEVKALYGYLDRGGRDE